MAAASRAAPPWDRHFALLLATLILTVGPATFLGAELAGTPVTAGAQTSSPCQDPPSGQATFVHFKTRPLVLAPTGGLLTVDMAACRTAAVLDVTVEFVPPTGGSALLVETTRLVAREPGQVGGELEAALPGSSPPGWWTARVRDVFAVSGTSDGDGSGGQDDGNETRERLAPAGTTSTLFQVHPDRPVAGLTERPWPQTGGDPFHTGRTLSVGPATVDVVRWTWTALDRQPFHTPVVGADGRIHAVSWGGELYALDPDGRAQWRQPVRLGSQVPYPPALGADGNVLAVSNAGTLHAIAPDGTQAWRTELGAGGSGSISAPLSPPVVGADGRVHVLHEPWTLMTLSSDGQVLHQVPLERPFGLVPASTRTPAPLEGPAVALSTDGRAVVVAGNGLALLAPNGTVQRTVDCGCAPRSVSVLPGDDVAFVVGESEVVAIQLATGTVTWTTENLPSPPTGTIWSAPAIGWGVGANRLLHVVSEDGKLHRFSVDGFHVGSRLLSPPLRGQPTIDASGNIYVGDGCSFLHSLGPSGTIRWTEPIDSNAPDPSSCPGIVASPVVMPSGALLWPSPDGALRMLGANRLPTAKFTASWTGEVYRFDASLSRDPDGSPLTYAWDFGDGTTGRGPLVSHAYPNSGKYLAKLTVSDGTSIATATQDVVVNLPPVPIVRDLSEGLTLVLDASSSTDPEDDHLRFNWTVAGEPGGHGPVLVVNASGPHVYDVRLRLSDGTQTTTTNIPLLAPARATGWQAERTIVLFESASCPSGLCASPDRLVLPEGSLVELIVHGTRIPVQVSSELPAVPGGTNQLTLGSNEQGRMHLSVGAPGEHALQVQARDASGASATIPVSVRAAPSQVTWYVEAPNGTVRAGSEAGFTFVLEGTPPPGDAQLRLALERGGEEVAFRRVTLPAGQPVQVRTALTFVPGAAGTLVVTPLVRTTDAGQATVTAADGQPQTVTLEVLEPTLWTRATDQLQAASGLWVLAVVLALLLVSLVAAVVVLRRRGVLVPGADGEDVDGSGGTTASGTPLTTGDQTVASSFMPRKLDRFQIERVLGEGGFGKTYLATDSVLERRVVLKALEHLESGAARDALLHEARTAANLSHPNVVVVHDVIEEEGRLLLVMEYVEGGTLADVIQNRPVSRKQAMSLFHDLLAGLKALHDAGIVHRDLKPTNILVTPSGVAKITDFGVAARRDDVGGHNGDTFVGTPRYMAPEQLAGEMPGPQADLYAAGAILYEMLTGEHHLGVTSKTTVDASDLMVLRSELPVADLGEKVNAVLARALARDPAKRFRSVKAFAQAMHDLR